MKFSSSIKLAFILLMGVLLIACGENQIETAEPSANESEETAVETPDTLEITEEVDDIIDLRTLNTSLPNFDSYRIQIEVDQTPLSGNSPESNLKINLIHRVDVLATSMTLSAVNIPMLGFSDLESAETNGTAYLVYDKDANNCIELSSGPDSLTTFVGVDSMLDIVNGSRLC